MAQSVKLGDDIMSTVRRESELQSRSVAGQITHWLRTGRAIERSGRFDQAHINAALAGELESGVLRDEEHNVWLDSLVQRMSEAGPEQQRFFAGRQRLASAWGLTGRQSGARGWRQSPRMKRP